MRLVPCVGLLVMSACRRESVAVQKDPVVVDASKPPEPVREAVVGDHAACARIREDWWCWGATEPHEITGEGFDDVDFEVRQPHVVPWMHGAEQVAVGSGLFCALRRDGTVWCLGRSRALGQKRGGKIPAVDASDDDGSTVPVQMLLPKASSIISSDMATCILTANGEAHCFGNLPGIGTSGPHKLLGPRMRAIAPSWALTCALADDASVWCTSSMTAPPKRVLDGTTRVVAAWGHACALRSSEVWCWGGGMGTSPGVFGDGTEKDAQPVPAKVPGLPPTKELWAGGRTVCAVTNNGSTWCWGRDKDNLDLFAGLGPRAVEALAGLSQGAMQGLHGCALDREARLRCWGEGGMGRRIHAITFTETP